MAQIAGVIDKNRTVLLARELRRSMTLPEGLLWRQLRQPPEGWKFRRQHPLGPFVADFYCPAAKLVVEVDGASHGMGDRPSRDARRDHWLRGEGLRVVRFTAEDVIKDVESVLTAIILACRG